MQEFLARQYLYYAMSIGERLLISGAEVGRVEDTIKRICKSYGIERVDVFSITSSIVTTIYDPEFISCTQTRRVNQINSDLQKIDLLNQLSRKICDQHLKPEDIEAELLLIDQSQTYSFKTQLIIYAMVSASFCMFFGGSVQDIVVSGIIGVFLKIFEQIIQRGQVNPLIRHFICSIFGGILANLFVISGIGEHIDLISIGNIMLLIPGIAFTNSLRDMFSGDTITGLIRFLEAIILAVTIAIGFVVANFLF